MNIPKIPKDFFLKRFFSKTKPNISNESTVNIKDFDEDCEVVTIDKIGITELGQGALLLKTHDGKEFPMSAFSAETAKSISDFQQGKLDELPTIYNMVEQICENAEFLLESRQALDSQELADPFADLIGDYLDTHLQTDQANLQGTLYLNASCPLIRRLASLPAESTSLAALLTLVYQIARLFSGRALTAVDAVAAFRETIQAMTDLIT